MKFKVGDEVIVTAGKDKGKKGKLEKVLPKEASVLIANINMYKKYRKEKTGRTSAGGIVEFNRPLAVANVALVCPNCHKQTRIGYLAIKNQKKRVCKKCKTALE